MGWLFGRYEERDAKAKAEVEKKRRAKRDAEEKMSAELRNELNLIDQQHGYKGERGWW